MSSNDTLRNNTVPNAMAGTHATVADSVEPLNSLLRGEISAVETYRMAIEKLQSSGGPGVAFLTQLMASHSDRVQRLRAEVIRCGGEPSDGSGVWGAFAKLVEGAAELFGEKSAIAALEEGEDHGMKNYRTALEKLDVSTRAWVESTIFPEQQKTHNALSDFKKRLSS